MMTITKAKTCSCFFWPLCYKYILSCVLTTLMYLILYWYTQRGCCTSKLNRVLNVSFSKSVQCKQKKKTAALIIMHVTTFSDHSMWKFMNSVWNRKWVVWHKNKWSYICSIILLTYRTGFLENLKSFPLFSPCRAYGVTSVNAIHCQMKYKVGHKDIPLFEEV